MFLLVDFLLVFKSYYEFIEIKSDCKIDYVLYFYFTTEIIIRSVNKLSMI